DKNLLRNAIPGYAGGARTCLYDALLRTISAVSARPQKKIIIVLADGDDSGCGGSPSAVISAANTAGVMIYTVGIGGANHVALQSIASSTGGSFFEAQSNTELIDVYRQIATLLSQNQTVSLRIRGRAVAPMLSVTPVALQFDSTLVGSERCLDVTVSNTGDAPLRIVNVVATDAQFTASVPPDAILPGDSRQMAVCFRPSMIREQSGTLDIVYLRCAEETVSLSLTGIGWDSLTIALTGTYFEQPDRTIQIPVRIVGRPLPSSYDVRDYHLLLTYNTTVVVPEPAGGFTADGTLSASMPTIDLLRSNVADAGMATIDASGGIPLAGGGDLLRLRLRVLLGNSLQTELRLVDAQMADGNPRLNIITPANVQLDSTCYMPERLIDARARYGVTLLSNAPNPSRGWTMVRYHLEATVPVRLQLMSVLGDVIQTIDIGTQEKGIQQYRLQTDGLSPGVYYYRLEAGSESAIRKFIVAR
ncbi:MAG: VWA domain-containing protein, partial [Bacteroidetes bacterium]|nr:VWA domain-containing protein [Bacteroidota bacterium]